MEGELFHAGGWTVGRTDRQDEVNSRFSQFCIAPKNKCPQPGLVFVSFVKTGSGKAVLFLWECMKLHEITLTRVP
jgi:hypothetical protein